MSAIESVLRRACNQTAVYWGTPTNNGTGGFTYDDPVEISVRWQDKSQIVKDRSVKNGNSREFVSQAEVIVLQDVDENGYLFLGTLDDLGSAEEDNPAIVSGAYMIKRFYKTPDIRAQGYVRKAWL